MVDGVLDKAETPDGPDCGFMDSSSAAAEWSRCAPPQGTSFTFFPTGQGNIIGNPHPAHIKICATRAPCAP